MRIAFLGKGGSGKSTVSSAFVHYLARKRKSVVAIDADVNAHLQDALHLEGEAVYLGDKFDEVTQYLKGKRTDLDGKPMIATTPPSMKSTFIFPKFADPFLKKYALRNDKISLLTVGAYGEDDIAVACYHEKLATLVSVYHHMLDMENDFVVADSTAGVDNLGTSLLFTYDLNIFVVEPTEKSISVYNHFAKLADEHDVTVMVIVNKISSKKDEEFILSQIEKKLIIGFIKTSTSVRRYEQGSEEAFDEFIKENTLQFNKLYHLLKKKKKNWQHYQKKAFLCHKKLCQEWYNQYYGKELDKELDPHFTYEKVIQNLTP